MHDEMKRTADRHEIDRGLILTVRNSQRSTFCLQ